jgi:LDH2 family malate/lactate/ureidoglycolate dehydrogenase
MPTLTASELNAMCVSVLHKIGVPQSEAEIVSDNLVKANLRGIDAHGVFFLPRLVRKVLNKTIVPGAETRVVSESGSTALMDGGHGFGQVIGVRAMKMAIEKARAHGIGAVSARNTNHFGILSYYAMLALEFDMIGLVLCNAGPCVAPWGGRTPILGTNPLCFAIPSGKARPIVLDMSTSAASRAKILLAEQKKENIPEGWAIDREGRPATDPKAALEGALLPFGGAKGYGLSLVVDILAGALADTACGTDVKAMTFLEETSNMGQFYAAINVDSFVPIAKFKARVDALINSIKNSSPSEGLEEVLLPGEIESREEEKRLREGISISDETWRNLKSLIDEPSVS